MRLLLLSLLIGGLAAGLVSARFQGPDAGSGVAVAASSMRCPPPPSGQLLAVPGAIAVAPRGLPPPRVTARSIAIIDAGSGQLLFGNNEHLRLPPASTTKIMTALVTLQNADPDTVVNITLDARRMTGSSVMGLRPGMQFTVRDLLYGLMLPSGNDAAIVLAERVAGSVSSFVELMNEEVARLGLADTHYTNPHGLDSFGLYSSAYDLAMIGRYAMSDPRFAEIVRTPIYRPAGVDFDLYNGNTLLGSYPGADGIKIGWTENAGETFVASASRDGHRVIVAVLGSQNRAADATALLDWTFADFSWLHFNAGLARGLAFAEHLAPVQQGMLALVGFCLGEPGEQALVKPPAPPPAAVKAPAAAGPFGGGPAPGR